MNQILLQPVGFRFSEPNAGIYLEMNTSNQLRHNDKLSKAIYRLNF